MTVRLRIAGYVVQPKLVYDDDETGELSPGPGVNAIEVSGSQLAGLHADMTEQLPQIAEQAAQGSGEVQVNGHDAEEAVTAARTPRKTATNGNRAQRRSKAR